MFKCAKNCFNKSNIESSLQKTPMIWVALKSMYYNSFVQVLVLITLGIILLRYGEINKSQTTQTVAITIITASLFKFLVSANAFVSLISKVVQESFVDMKFIKHFNDTKLKSTTDTLINETIQRQYTYISKPLLSHILNILENQGYYSSVKITMEDKVTDKAIYTKATYDIICYATKTEESHSEIVFSTEDNNYKILTMKINNKDMIDTIRNNTTTKSEKEISYKIPYVAGKNKITIVEEYTDTDLIHAFFFNKTSSNVKVIYKHDNNIINPIIVSKYGEIKESNSKVGELYRDYGDKIFIANEFIFIKFNLKEKK